MDDATAGHGYHHGNLRAALLAAAEAELIDTGIEKFSMRAVAKRAGVSHAAPAHHFKDADGLLTALTALSFDRFRAAMERQANAAGADPLERLVGSGIGYIEYASANPALFDLLFFSDRPDRNDADLAEAGRGAFAHLEERVAALLAHRRSKSGETKDDAIVTAWALAHGLAALFARRRSRLFEAKSPKAREATFRRILRGVFGAL